VTPHAPFDSSMRQIFVKSQLRQFEARAARSTNLAIYSSIGELDQSELIILKSHLTIYEPQPRTWKADKSERRIPTSRIHVTSE